MPSYKKVVHDGKVKQEHRVIWEKHKGKIPEGMLIHHVNKNPRDNRIENLQMVTKSEHAQLHVDNTKLNEIIKKLLLKRCEDNQNSTLDQNKKSPPKANRLIGIRCCLDFAQETVIEGFRNHLERQKLSERTVKEYMYYLKRMAKDYRDLEFNQDTVNLFLTRSNSSPARAYMRQLLLFLKNKEIEIIKLRGRKPRKKPNMMSDDEKEKIASHLYGWQLKYGLMFELTDECALRRGEVVGIQLEDFDWENWKYEQTRPCRLKIRGKGNKERYVVVSPNLMLGLLEYLKRVKQEENKPFFKLSYARWDAVFRKACLKALGKAYKLHEIRHSTASRWYNEGKDITQIKNRLGHASISTTQLYINPDEEQEIMAWEKEL